MVLELPPHNHNDFPKPQYQQKALEDQRPLLRGKNHQFSLQTHPDDKSYEEGKLTTILKQQCDRDNTYSLVKPMLMRMTQYDNSLMVAWPIGSAWRDMCQEWPELPE